MIELVQKIVVAREGVVKTDAEEFLLDSLVTIVKVSLKYSLSETEKHGQHGHGRILLTDNPVVLGGHFPVRTTSYNPFGDISAFEFATTEFVPRYEFLIKQPIDVWLHGTTGVIAETRIVAKGPDRIPEQLDVMPTAIVDRFDGRFAGPPLILAPNEPKQEFQLLVDPFGGEAITKTARVEISYADRREPGILLIVPYEASLPGSGLILGDGTGAVFVATGLKTQRNYVIELDVDGEKKYKWQATTKTGTYFDQFRKRLTNENH